MFNYLCGVVQIWLALGAFNDAAKDDANINKVKVTSLAFVCVTSDKNITVEFSSDNRKRIQISPWYNSVSMAESDFELTNLYNFLFQEAVNLIKVALHAMYVGSDGLQVFQHVLGTRVTSAKDVAHTFGDQHLFERGGNLCGAVWDVKITEDQHQFTKIF